MSSRQNDTLAATLLALGAALLLLASIGIFLQGWTERRLAEEERTKVFEPVYSELEAYRQEQGERLAGYRWIDAEAGTVQLPVERAMELVVAEATPAEPAPAPAPEATP